MKTQLMRVRVLLIAGLLMGVAACSTPPERDEDVDVSLNDDVENVQGDADLTDTDLTDSDAESTGLRNPIDWFEYQEVTEGCGEDECGLIVRVDVGASTILRTLNGVGDTHSLEVSDVEDFEKRVLTREIADNYLFNGGRCGSSQDELEHEGVTYYFLTSFSGGVIVGNTITRCVVNENPDVKGIIQVMQDLRYKYYPEDIE